MPQALIKRLGFGGVSRAQKSRLRRNPRDMRFTASAFLLALVLVSVLFFYIWCRLTVVSMGYEISKADIERDVLMEQNRRLKIDFMELKSPQRIERIAMEELRLVHPAGGQIIQVSE